MRRSRLMRAAVVVAAAAFAAAGCGEDEDAPGARAPGAGAAPPAEQARVSAQALTACANRAPGRTAPASDPRAYAQQGLARLAGVIAVLRGVPADGAEQERLRGLADGSARLRPLYDAVLRPGAARAERRRAVDALREEELRLQQEASVAGLGACGPLPT